MRAIAAGVALVLAGCASEPMALYRHPVTNDRKMCAREAVAPTTTGLDVLDLLLTPIYAADLTVAGTAYADCKTRLEQQGYVRE